MNFMKDLNPYTEESSLTTNPSYRTNLKECCHSNASISVYMRLLLEEVTEFVCLWLRKNAICVSGPSHSIEAWKCSELFLGLHPPLDPLNDAFRALLTSLFF